MHVRAGNKTDLAEVARIQKLSPEAAQWSPTDYPLLIAEQTGQVCGFLVWRQTALNEVEILNLAVDPSARRCGAARLLIAALPNPAIFLEVRESNAAARALYESCGFREAGVRFGYYENPPETAIVMRLQK